MCLNLKDKKFQLDAHQSGNVNCENRQLLEIGNLSIHKYIVFFDTNFANISNFIFWTMQKKIGTKIKWDIYQQKYSTENMVIVKMQNIKYLPK